MRFALPLIAATLVAMTPAGLCAQTSVATAADLNKFNVTIVRFDPARGPQTGVTFVLPVDSPDEEHAIASTLANAASFSHKTDAGRALPVAFMAVRVARR